MAEEKVLEAPQDNAPDISGKSSDDIKNLLSEAPEEKPSEKPEEKPEVKPEGKPEEKPEEKSGEQPKPEQPKDDDWFDKERGFKTKDDALKSYANLQNTLRERAEREKQLQVELDSIKQKAEQRPLTDDEKKRQEEVESWKNENRDALEFLKKEIKSDLERENQQKSIQEQALSDRKKWKEEFDKDDSRKALWPVMEEVYSKSNVMQDFYKNPFPFIEAMAFKQNFSNIAEQIRAEAVEQYKAQAKEAEEAERQNATGRPGGTKKQAGEVDPSKMSSGDIASLLSRNEDG